MKILYVYLFVGFFTMLGGVFLVFKDRDYLIEENLDFIIHTTEQTCKRKISTENDDEFSIALIAFNKACDSYDKDKGDFNAYCKKVIKNALIDYFRKNCSNPTLYDENSFNVLDFKLSMDDYSKQKDSLSKQDIIQNFNKELSIYNISLSDLVSNSPKHKDTRNNLISLCLNLISNNEVMTYLKSRKCLNVNLICESFNVKRKLIEKWRKYLIALIIVLSSPQFKYLKDYLNLEMVGDKID